MVGRMFNPSMNELTNRLHSFAEWPSSVAVKPKDLAEAGFYYLGGNRGGNDDTVCCFNCGGTLNDWQIGDIPEEKHRRFFGNRCEFLKRHGIDTLDSSVLRQRNTPARPATGFDPIDNDMENEEQRLRSFQRNNGWAGAIDPHRMATAGFYYTGIHDHVKCFACDVSLKAWMPEDDPVAEHLRLKPNCTFISRFTNKFTITHTPSVSTQEMGSSPSSSGETFRSISQEQSVSYRPVPPTVSTHVQRRERILKPNYASEHARLHTFINWPKECPVQPKELIDAGFYYTGNEDKVECFKCGIILAGWEPHDTPWGEHVKWSKDCPLVIENLRRRNPHSPAQGPRAAVLPQEQTWKTPPKPITDICPPEMGNEAVKASNTVRLPSEQSECSKMGDTGKSKRIPEEGSEGEIFYLQKAAQRLIENKRYDCVTIQEAIQQRTKIEGQKIYSMEELLDAIQSYQETSNRESTSLECCTGVIDAPSTSTTQAGGFALSVDPEALHKQVQKMQDAHRCKICLDAEIGIVFLPCGHLVCCPKCAQEIQLKRDCLCPICRRHIDNTIRTYLT